MKRLLLATIIILLVLPMQAQERFGEGSIYHDGWIDFNKNGIKDVYEDPSADINTRIEDLLSQMNLEEKTCRWLHFTAIRESCMMSFRLPSGRRNCGKTG